MKEVLPGLWKIHWIEVNAFLIASDGTAVLVDTGSEGTGKAERILSAARTANGDGSIDHILLTHCHLDHIGNVAELAAATGATVWAPQGDVHIIKGGGRPPDVESRGPLGWVLSRAIHMREQDGRPVHEEVLGGQRLDLVGGIQVIETPGHTGGHVSFLWQAHGGVLFTGDAAGNLLTLGPFSLNEDNRRAEQSFVELAGRVFEAAMFGHGRDITKGASDRFKRAARRLS